MITTGYWLQTTGYDNVKFFQNFHSSSCAPVYIKYDILNHAFKDDKTQKRNNKI